MFHMQKHAIRIKHYKLQFGRFARNLDSLTLFNKLDDEKLKFALIRDIFTWNVKSSEPITKSIL
jgi:hypothetical protein